MNWRDRALLFVASVSIAATTWLFLAPETVPLDVDRIVPHLDERVGTRLAAVLLGLTVLRLLIGSTVPVDRSPITDTTPELAAGAAVSPMAADLGATYDRVVDRFESPGRVERRTATYGRRTVRIADVPVSIERFLDELAAAARDVYATKTGCDDETAAAAVVAGTWTDDRIAAAFLASDLDAEPTFSKRERAVAWLTPRRTFEARVDRVLRVLEDEAGTFLSFDPETPTRPTSGPDRPTGRSLERDD